MKNYQSTSTVQPEEWDKTSSAEKVYHNKNVTEVPATDENPVMYQYDVDEYEKLEYLQMQNVELQTMYEQSEAEHTAELAELVEVIYDADMEVIG